MIRKMTLIALIMMVFVAAFTAADTGIGLILGDPTGISLLFGERVALGIAWDASNYFHFHTDVWFASGLLATPVEWYAGVGGKLQVYNAESDAGPTWDAEDEADDDFGIGVRIPLGLQWYAAENVELFGEVAPGIQLLPSTAPDVDAGLGVRIHF